jgi:hypothetical protein
VPALDDFLARHAPHPPLAVDPRLVAARESLVAALATLAEVRDADLEKPWPWRGDEADVRYGLYRPLEALIDIRAAVRPGLPSALTGESAARPLVGEATAARWEVDGVLAGLSDADLDAAPGGEEWTVRQTLAHIVNGQRAYGWFTAWWHSRRDLPTDDFPPAVPDDVAAELPDESTEADGSLAEIRERLGEVTDMTCAVFAALGPADMTARARWSGYPVDLRFRLTRWPSHIREHTVQVDKTLVMIGRATTEVERVLRLIGAAYGRLEEELYLWPAGESAVSSAAGEVESVLRGVAAEALTVREAADA